MPAPHVQGGIYASVVLALSVCILRVGRLAHRTLRTKYLSHSTLVTVEWYAGQDSYLGLASQLGPG